VHVIDRRVQKVETCRQTLCHVPGVCLAIEWLGCLVTVLYKEPSKSLIPPLVWCVGRLNFEHEKHWPAGIHWKLVEVCEEGDMTEGILQGRCAQRSAGCRLSSPRILKTWLIFTFLKIRDSLLMSLMKFPHMFLDLSSTRLSQFHSDTEKFVPDGFHEGSHMSISTEEKKQLRTGYMKWRSTFKTRESSDLCNIRLKFYV
jgi:hypothetical protein